VAGIKAKWREHGAVGADLFRPNEDGFQAGRKLSGGAVASRDGVQRGSFATIRFIPAIR